MSFSLSKKLSVKLNDKNKDTKAESAAAAATAKKTGFGLKQNPVLLAKTEDYVDDEGLYQPRINRGDRMRYFDFIIANWKQKRKGRQDKNTNQSTWISEKIKETNDEANYPQFYVKLFRFLRSARWDHLYLDCFIIFIILCVIFFDGIAADMLPALAAMQNSVLALPCLGMLVCATLPCLGTAYFVHYGNDLVLYTASHDFQHWAFTSALTAQYIEYFSYGGRGARDNANNLRPDALAKNHRPMWDAVKKLGRACCHVVNILRRRGAAAVEPDSDEEGSGNDEESQAAPPVASEPAPEKQTKPQSKVQEMSRVVVSTSRMDDDEENSLDTFEREQKGPPVEEVEWTCLVCNAFNPLQRKVPLQAPEVDLYFGTHGVHYQRLFVKMVPRPNKPVCKKCTTPYDYAPPLGSAHLFPFNPDPYQAFSDYPAVPTMQHGLKDTPMARRQNAVKSFLYGLQSSFDSTPLENDWRLKKWIADKFPPIPRYLLAENERYHVGEIVECLLQKSEYCRARIINIRANNSYDIRYDTGDELRFVPPSMIRLGAEKGAFMYRAEIAMVGMVLGLPLGLLLALISSNAGMVFLPALILGAGLFAIRLNNLIQYTYNFPAAGLCVVLRATAFFTLPLLFLFITGVVGFAGGADLESAATGVSALMILTFFFSLPVLYVIRPHYAIIGMGIFTQVSIGAVLLSMQLSSKVFPSIGVALAPFLTACLCLKYLRGQLHALWDVCLVIRPALNRHKKMRNFWWDSLVHARKTIIYYLP